MSDTEDRVRLRAYHLWEAAGCPPGQHEEFWHRARELEPTGDVDIASNDSFPASDPPANTGITGPTG